MKKKIFIALLALTAVFACVFGFTACNKHEHVYGRPVSIKSPNCQTEGEWTYECEICGEKKVEIIPVTGHSYGDPVTVTEATCTENGLKRFTCTVCGSIKEEQIVAEGHKYNAVEEEKATCQKAGLMRYTCRGCGKNYTEVIPVTDHSYDNGVLTKAPTCTEEGIKTFTCVYCARSYTEAVPANGHNPTEFGQAVEATCEHTGKTAGSICSVCKTVLEEQEIIPVADHRYEMGLCVWCKIEKQFTIQFVANGKTVKTDTFTVSNKNIEEPAVPHIEGYEDGRWESYTLGYKDVTVNALYTPQKFIISLEAEGGSLSAVSVKVTFGENYSLPVPSYAGYDFVGWYDGQEDGAVKYSGADGAGLSAYSVASDKTLYAKWAVKVYTVSFVSNGNELPSKQFRHGEKFTVDKPPAIEGLTFDGWYSADGTVQYTEDTVITENLTVYAVWIESIAVSNAEQLIAISSAPDKNYHLTNDIDLRGTVWTPVATFSGKLNGRGYKVKNFVLSSTAPGDNFGFININIGTIENTNFSDFTFNIVSSNSNNTSHSMATIVALNKGSVLNCNLLNGVFKVKYSQDRNSQWDDGATYYLSVGGIVGTNDENGVVSGCYSLIDSSYELSVIESSNNYHSSDLRSNAYLGGIVGLGKNKSKIENCYYKAAITISAYARGTTISGISGSNRYHNANNIFSLGGVLGVNSSSALINSSYSNSTITITTSVGGSARANYARVGGLVGRNESARINSCYSVGTINGGSETDSRIGGLVGFNDTAAVLESSYAAVTINTQNGGTIGGLVGYNAAVIQNSYASGGVASTTSSNIGGFVGNNGSSGTISKCYSTGDVTTVGGNIGHFIGLNSGVIFKCYFLQGATLLSSGKYIDRVVEYNTIEGQLYSKLWSEEFLVNELYWDAEGWVIIVDENPLLQWEIEVSHDFRTMEVEPTCEYGGFTIYNCADCNRLFVKDFKDPLGHNWEDVRTIPASCTADGYTLQSCTRDGCGEERHVNTVPAKGHPEDKVTVKDGTHSATCTKDGFTVYSCSVCNSDYRVNEKAKGHDGEYVSTVTAATCTEEGEDVYYCIVCLEEYRFVTEKTEHNWVDVAYKAASCGTVIEGGEIVGRNPVTGNMPGVKCGDCGEVKYGCEEINPHKYELIETSVTATCETDGKGKYRCAECLIEEEIEIPAYGHTDADRDNICDVCGELAFTVIKKSAFTHITDVNGLKGISANPSGFYWLDCDIDLSGTDWTPIGTEQLPFKGIFYGDNHTVSGLSFNVSNSETTVVAGLFGYNKGQIVNLKVSSFSLTVVNASAVFGGIAAYNNGSVLNCELTGENKISFTVSKTITENKQTYVLEHDLIAGGIAGINDQTASIESCKVSGTLTSTHVNNCAIETKNVSTLWQLIGQWMIQFIYETKVSTIQHISLGGIAGRNEGAVKDCTVTSQIVSDSDAAAHLSQMRGTAIAYTYLYAGALVGYNTGSVSNCSAKAMAYRIKDEHKYMSIPDIITGKTYSLGYWIYDYSKDPEAITGIIGTNSAFGTVDGFTAL